MRFHTQGRTLSQWAGLSAPLVAVLLCLTTSSCFRVEWSRISTFVPIPEEPETDPVVGEADINACMEQFGSPLWVLEHPIDGQDGALLAWGWFYSRDVGFRVSYAFDRFVTSSLEYKQTDENMLGIVAIFDGDWQLVELKRGLLRNLTTDIPMVRPKVILTE